MSLECESRKFWDDEALKWVEQKPLGAAAPDIRDYINTNIKQILPMIPQESMILDLGTGANTQGYFNSSDWSRIIGLDTSKKMLQLNKINNKVNAVLNKTLPIKNNSIGLITSIFTMRYQSRSDHLQMLQEYYRVLIPGGQLLIIDVYSNDYDLQFSTFNPDQLKEIAQFYGYISVDARNDSLSQGGYSDGWGSRCGGWSVYLNRFLAVKPMDSELKAITEDQMSKYLKKEEDGKHFIRSYRDKIGAF